MAHWGMLHHGDRNLFIVNLNRLSESASILLIWNCRRVKNEWIKDKVLDNDGFRLIRSTCAIPSLHKTLKVYFRSFFSEIVCENRRKKKHAKVYLYLRTGKNSRWSVPCFIRLFVYFWVYLTSSSLTLIM